MKCFNKYRENDINCEFCERIKDGIFSDCKQRTLNRWKLEADLKEIKNHCGYHDTAWDEYTKFDSCHKNGNGYGRHADDCNPKLECRQYWKKYV